MRAPIDDICSDDDLGFDRSEAIFRRIVSGDLDEVTLSALVTALKAKGESPGEIAGAAEALRSESVDFPAPDYPVADTCGTGGDDSGSVNISTAVAFVAAELGVPVVKHGNRSVSSKCGSADVLEAAGVEIELEPDAARRCLDEAGICFLFAPNYHPGIRHAMGVRNKLETRTIFNLLGPLVNPSRPDYQLMGVYDPDLCRPMARTLDLLGCERAAVVHGSGLDELAIHDSSRVAYLEDGAVHVHEITPEDAGVDRHPLESLSGGGPEENAAWLRELLSGEGEPVHNQAVALNAGAVARTAGLADSLKEGTTAALELLHSGTLIDRLERLVEVSRDA